MSNISHSRVDSYLTCRRKEYYGYHLKLTRKRSSAGLALGSAGHDLLATFYSTILTAGNTKTAQKKAVPDAIEALKEQLKKLYADGFEDSKERAPLKMILENYLQREPFVLRSGYEDKKAYRILAVEKEFNWEYDSETESRYPFIIDLIVEAPNKKIMVVDHKFLYDFYSYSDSLLMGQIPKYIGALRGLGHKISGTGIYNMIRTRPNTQAGRPPAEWCLAMDVDVPGVRVQRTFLEQAMAANEIRELAGLSDEERDVRAYRTGNSLVCKSCPFNALCVEELRGGNVELAIRSQYEPKKESPKIAVTPAI